MRSRPWPVSGLRDRALFVLGVKSGFRMELFLVPLQVRDVVRDGQVLERVYLARNGALLTGEKKQKSAGALKVAMTPSGLD